MSRPKENAHNPLIMLNHDILLLLFKQLAREEIIAIAQTDREYVTKEYQLGTHCALLRGEKKPIALNLVQASNKKGLSTILRDDLMQPFIEDAKAVALLFETRKREYGLFREKVTQVIFEDYINLTFNKSNL